jgi:DNA mismatch repair protein MutL
MGNIRVLPQTVADRIAAGEVVERPASVVRELLDNALDAGAARLELDLEDGGRALVALADDGCGMGRDDALLAFERHATSKIRSGDDLDAVRTLGFRGEALAAIGAVAHVTLLTRPAEQEAGTRVVLERGRLSACDPASRARGTTLRVRDLFGGIPARRKFLKSAGTELDHCLRAARRAALARPDVGLRVRHDGRRVLDLPGVEDAGERVRALLGDRWGSNLLPVSGEALGMQLWGWVGRSDVHRPTREGIQLLVNRRPVRDPFLLRAVTDAFRNTLPPGRFPVAVVFLDLPPDEVDVNVHPAKLEVRFHRLREVRGLVTGAIAGALGGRAAMPWLGGAAPPHAGHGAGVAPGPQTARPRPPTGLFDAALAADRADEAVRVATAGWASPPPAPAASGRPRALAQLRDCYIVAEDDRGLLIVDQHVAHERLLYERLLAQAERGPLPRQAALFPAALEVGPERCEQALAAADLLLCCGFRVESFGTDTIKVSEVPAVMDRQAGPEAVVAVLERLAAGERNPTEPMLHRLLATVACHTAVRKGMPLNREKMDYILGGLEACEAPHHCPHGRVVSLRVDLSALDRNFERS